MSHTYQLSRQFQQEPIKTGGIVINPEDAHPHMRDQIHMDPKSGTYAVLKPHHSDKTFTRELQYEFTRPRTEKGLVKTGGILINPEDALPSMRHHIHTDSRSGSTYALLKPAKENLRNSDPITRRFSCEFTRSSMREDPIKTGGIIINPEDALPSMRHQLHTDPRSGSTYALLKPQIHTRKFSYEFTRPSVGQDPVKTGGIIIRPEDALESMRHSIHVDPRSHSTYANLKPWSQTHGSSSDASMPMEGQRRFSYEFTRDAVKGDRVKTGGIVIRPEDALPHMRDQIRVHPRSHSTYANLKPWRQSQGDSGIIDTRSSLDEMGSHVDSLITRSRNILSESGVYSIPSLGYLGEMGSSYVA